MFLGAGAQMQLWAWRLEVLLLLLLLPQSGGWIVPPALSLCLCGQVLSQFRSLAIRKKKVPPSSSPVGYLIP